MQATGADILRLACIEGHRRGLQLCGSVHDAVLIESSLEQIDADVALMREIMRRASRVVLGDYELRTGVDIVRYPDSYLRRPRRRDVDRSAANCWSSTSA